VGANTLNNRASIDLRISFNAVGDGIGYIYVKGVVKRPMRKAREKLSVAREERKSPSKSRDNDFMSKYCWVVGAKKCVRVVERMNGSTLFIAAKAKKTAVSI
jgi:hypothetical protein